VLVFHQRDGGLVLIACKAEQQRRLRDARLALADCDHVVDIREVDRPADIHQSTLEIVLDAQAGGYPAPVAREVALHGLTIRPQPRQGPHWQALLVA
jgi:hypothetical protein